MTTQQPPVVFKSEDALWQQLKSGERRFDMRRYDMSDERIYRLSFGHRAGPSDYVYRLAPNRLPLAADHVPDVSEVTFVNKLTGEALTLAFRGLEFTSWAPGWVFLILKPFVPEVT